MLTLDTLDAHCSIVTWDRASSKPDFAECVEQYRKKQIQTRNGILLGQFVIKTRKSELKSQIIWISHNTFVRSKHTIHRWTTSEWERTIVSDSVVLCVQTMESYFYYSMEKCLHYSANNTKLDSSEIFPPHNEKNEEKKKSKRMNTTKFWSNTSIFSSLVFLFSVLSFCCILKFCVLEQILKPIAFSRRAHKCCICTLHCSFYSFWLAALLPAAPESKIQRTKVHETKSSE